MSASVALDEPGVPPVTEIEAFLTEVDGEYNRRRRDVQPITWKSSKIPVKTTFSLPVPVELSGTVVDYSFKTVNNDIQFGVHFSSEGDNPETEVVIETKRFDSHLEAVKGTFHLAHPGCLTLVWDNRYFCLSVLTHCWTKCGSNHNCTISCTLASLNTPASVTCQPLKFFPLDQISPPSDAAVPFWTVKPLT
ncbi:unnamed protein product [Choristocarpus tenellus]